jgi:ankyrin repeat protein
MLLRRGVGVNSATEEDHNIALVDAASACNIDLIRWLSDQGADVNARNRYGETALIEAVSYNQPAVVDLLLRRGADPRAASNGETVLDRARGRGDPRIIALIEEALRRK